MNSQRLSRREVFKVAGGLALAATLPFSQRSIAGMWSQVFGSSPRDVSPITPNEEFYFTSYRTPPFHSC